jgi:chromosome segregation ATPase
MRTVVHLVVVGGLLLGLAITGAGCNGAGAVGGGADARKARLFEDENYRLGEQIKGLEKQVEELKAAVEAAGKAKDDYEKACSETSQLLMEQITQKDSENQKLREKLAQMEKGTGAAQGQPTAAPQQ